MKILYAIQGTGNGHLSRARAVIPHLEKYGELDLLVSGTEAEVDLPYPIQYKSKGISFHYNKKAGIHYSRTLFQNLPKRILTEIREFPVNKYDIVINDFEPISAWACRKKKVPCIALSHQASYLSPLTPRPVTKNLLGEFILHTYAPVEKAVGFHFKPYDHFIHTPVIREEIRRATVMDAGHFTMYLPAIGDDYLLRKLSDLPEIEWHVFSRYTSKAYKKGRISVFPVRNDLFIQSFTSCSGIFTSAGFETPAEAMYMGKKLLVSPIKGQYEQQCNAVSLKELGIPVIKSLNTNTLKAVENWIYSQPPVQCIFPDYLPDIIEELMGEDFSIPVNESSTHSYILSNSP